MYTWKRKSCSLIFTANWQSHLINRSLYCKTKQKTFFKKSFVPNCDTGLSAVFLSPTIHFSFVYYLFWYWFVLCNIAFHSIANRFLFHHLSSVTTNPFRNNLFLPIFFSFFFRLRVFIMQNYIEGVLILRFLRKCICKKPILMK